MNAIVLLNPSAGSLFVRKAASDPRRVAAAFAAAGVDADVQVVGGADLQPAVRRAARRHADMLVVGGGDGSVRAAAAVLAGTDVPLGVLPLGTLNHFARDLRIPFHLDDAVRVLVEGRGRAIDVAEVNGHVFVNNAAIGSYPRLVEEREKHRQRRKIGKWRAAALAFGATFLELPRVDLELSAAGLTTPVTTSFLLVGNNRYGTGLRDFGRRAHLDEGVLSVWVAHGGGRWDATESLVRLVAGRPGRDTTLRADVLDELTVDARSSRVRIAVDGEVRHLTAPLHFSVRRGALHVVAPVRR
jgi:diacylglycerol kinase family enzyme